MEKYERRRIEALVATDEELKGLWKQHLSFERELEELDGRLHLTADEEFERKRLQKLKLAGKDRIAEILARYETPTES